MSEEFAAGVRTAPLAIPQFALVSLFVTALVTAQVTASKVLAFPSRSHSR